ncbi:MAG: tetratricopeptide repeat protein [Planctomycetaceae bacterium]|jgi:tetratricopeptide (TPR) repeat protein|nr:tetratricopeptide repeat protein [Planctomycetaceae bacterium]
MTNNTIQTLTAAQFALRKGDVKQAEHRFKELLNSEPHNLHALDGMGMIHCQLGDSKKAISFFIEALENCTRTNPYPLAELDANSKLTNTDKSAILLHLGVALRTIGNTAEALETLQKAYSITPNSPEIILNLGQLHFELEQLDEAIGCFRLLTELQPQNASAWLTLGFILSLNGFFKIPANETNNINKPIALNALSTETNLQQHNNKSDKSDFDKTKFNEALNALKTALKLDNASPDACFYIAEMLRGAEMYNESMPYYQRLLQIGNEWPQAVQNYGKILLATNNLEDGWDAMEFRFAAEFGTWSTHNFPQWSQQNNQNKPPQTKTILAYAEDSIASEIMFASCLPDLINEVDNCVIECEPSLHQLFKRSFPRAIIIESGCKKINPAHNSTNSSNSSNSSNPNDSSAASQIDFNSGQILEQNYRNDNNCNDNVCEIKIDEQIAFGSLPRYFRRSYADFPLRKSYLVPDVDKVCNWVDRLSTIGNMPKIGVLWRGCWTSETVRQCTLPMGELRNLMLQHQNDAAWINLQNKSGQKEFENYNRNVSIRLHKFNEIFQYDLDSMAALLTSLDLVITPPGYVAHLAGALGVKSWLLLPSGSDWRWNLGKTDAVWHPSMKIYRKKIEQCWDELFELVGVDLDRFLSGFRVQSNSVSGVENIACGEPAIIKFPAPINSYQTTPSQTKTTFKLKKAS